MAHKETRTLPIVFVGVSDPVGVGLVKSLGRQFVPSTTGADHNGGFLTGASANQSHNTNLVFARLTYKFC